jgi:hypothetical protein
VHGPQGDHAAIRTQVVQFLREHEEHFAPFVENDETFHSYTQVLYTYMTAEPYTCSYVSDRAVCASAPPSTLSW